MDITTCLGYLGTFCIAVQYLLIVNEKVEAFGLRACLVNHIGSNFVLISLYYHYNAPAFFIEIFWSSVSFYGILRNLKKKNFLKVS